MSLQKVRTQVLQHQQDVLKEYEDLKKIIIELSRTCTSLVGALTQQSQIIEVLTREDNICSQELVELLKALGRDLQEQVTCLKRNQSDFFKMDGGDLRRPRQQDNTLDSDKRSNLTEIQGKPSNLRTFHYLNLYRM